jgi:hypothetical protein
LKSPFFIFFENILDQSKIAMKQLFFALLTLAFLPVLKAQSWMDAEVFLHSGEVLLGQGKVAKNKLKFRKDGQSPVQKLDDEDFYKVILTTRMKEKQKEKLKAQYPGGFLLPSIVYAYAKLGKLKKPSLELEIFRGERILLLEDIQKKSWTNYQSRYGPQTFSRSMVTYYLLRPGEEEAFRLKGVSKVFSGKARVKQLAEYFSDCPELAQKLLRDEFGRAEGSDLKAVVRFYEEKCED